MINDTDKLLISSRKVLLRLFEFHKTGGIQNIWNVAHNKMKSESRGNEGKIDNWSNIYFKDQKIKKNSTVLFSYFPSFIKIQRTAIFHRNINHINLGSRNGKRAAF